MVCGARNLGDAIVCCHVATTEAIGFSMIIFRILPDICFPVPVNLVPRHLCIIYYSIFDKITLTAILNVWISYSLMSYVTFFFWPRLLYSDEIRAYKDMVLDLLPADISRCQ